MENDSDAVSRASLIISFCHMTSAAHDDALFFLESHNFDLDAALSSFFKNSSSQPNFRSPTQHADHRNPSGTLTGGTSTLSNLKRPPTDTAAYDPGDDSRN